jgi:translation initiation factor 2B subunit (eIF-2B alpha/beta/delta family)
VYRLPSSFDSILSDRTRGSSDLSAQAARLLADFPDRLAEPDFVALGRALLNRRPQFALLHHLLHWTGREAFGVDGRHSFDVQSGAAHWLNHWQAARRRIRLPEPPAGTSVRIITLSFSGTVLESLVRLHSKGAQLDVHCCLSLPGGEGAALASALGAHGVSARLVDDGEAAKLLGPETWVVLGADAIFPHAFWNKVGSLEIVQASRAAGGPVLVVAESAKWAHPEWRLALSGGQPVVGDWFEVVDIRLVTTVVSELGPVGPDDLQKRFEPPPHYPPLSLSGTS